MPRNSICLLDLLVCFCNDRTAKGDLLIICMRQDWLVVLLFSGEFIQFRLQKDVIWNVMQGIAGAWEFITVVIIIHLSSSRRELKCANCVIHDAVKGCPSEVCKSLQLELAISRMAYSLTQGQKMLVQK